MSAFACPECGFRALPLPQPPLSGDAVICPGCHRVLEAVPLIELRVVEPDRQEPRLRYLLGVADERRRVRDEASADPNDCARRHLPDCMMPDGGECCVAYRELLEENERLKRDEAQPIGAPAAGSFGHE